MWDLVQLNLLQHFTVLVPFLNGCNIATNFASLQRHGSSELEMTCTDLSGCAAAGIWKIWKMWKSSHSYCFHIWCQAVIRCYPVALFFLDLAGARAPKLNWNRTLPFGIGERLVWKIYGALAGHTGSESQPLFPIHKSRWTPSHVASRYYLSAAHLS